MPTPPAKPYIISVVISNSLYEIRLRSTTVTSITIFGDDSRLQTNVTWDELDSSVKIKIINAVKKRLQSNE
jgi:hypothetical protein